MSIVSLQVTFISFIVANYSVKYFRKRWIIRIERPQTPDWRLQIAGFVQSTVKHSVYAQAGECLAHSCRVGLKCRLHQLKDGCPCKVGQRLGIPLTVGWSYRWELCHTSLSVCRGPLLSWSKPPQAKLMSRYRHTLRRKGGQGALLSGSVQAHECVLCSHYYPWLR